MNPDLTRERERATFAPERITHMLDGGKANTERRRHLEKLIERDPTGIFDNSDNSYLHRTERHVRAIAKHVRLVELCRKLGIGDECGGEITESKDFLLLTEAIADDLPTALHWAMFTPNIRSLCDDEQQARWLPMCRDWRVIGCYAQTELGHGSNIRALETTATFQPGGEGSWVIHSPTLTSSKFWPGTLGRTANHAMVIARLIDGEGVDRGIHNFLVPLRSMEDHKLLPGVVTGDIGPKLGYNNMDNGFARFDHVVIPRRNMAMKFAQVDKNGKYSKKSVSAAASKVAYITMMQVRSMIVKGASKGLSFACTITIRYSAVRRQGYADESSGKSTELQVLDYKQQQYRIFPLLAASYCFYFTGEKLWKQLKSIEEKIMASKPVTKTEVSDIHASTSALKSFCTTVAADGIEECRKACGGHGFLESSALPELMKSYLPNTTVEGDNHMLPQQVVKVLLKLVQAVHSKDEAAIKQYQPCESSTLIPSLKSMLHGNPERCFAKRAEDMLKLHEILIPAFRHRAARMLVRISQQIQKAMARGVSAKESWNLSLIEMTKASRSYSLYLLLQNFCEGIATNTYLEKAECDALYDLARLFAFYWIDQEMGEFLEDGYLSPDQADWVRSNLLDCLDKVRPNAVAFVDAFDISDFRLKSTLGRYDGNVYPHIMDAAKRDPLNAVDPGPAYEPALKKLITGGVGVYNGTASRL